MDTHANDPQPPTVTGPAAPSSSVAPVPRKGRFAASWPWALAGLIVVGFVAVVTWRIVTPQADVWTDNAYVRVHSAVIAPRISGQVTAVRVGNDDVVRVGQVLVELDDLDARAAVAAAEAGLSRDHAMVENAAASILRQKSVIDQTGAQVNTASAQLDFAKADATRYDYLAKTGSGAVKTQQQADSALRQSRAALDEAKAALEAAQAQMSVLQTQEVSARASVRASEAQLDQARLNLSYTKVLAPVDGMVAQRGVQVGNYVNAGAGMMAVVPLSEVYVEANYREVELKHVQTGQRARIHVDAYDIDLEGTVVGVPAATGATFATIQPDNATGNFTKIVQRVPVKIVLDDHNLKGLLRPGMSAEPTVNTKATVIAAREAETKISVRASPPDGG